MLNFRSFQSAKCVVAGIESIHVIRKGRIMPEGCTKMSFAAQFYALQGNSVQFEGLAIVPAKITLSSGLPRNNVQDSKDP